MQKTLTTAQALGQYRRDLIEEGFKAEVAEHMCVEAARLVIGSGDGGLCVSRSEGES